MIVFNMRLLAECIGAQKNRDVSRAPSASFSRAAMQLNSPPLSAKRTGQTFPKEKPQRSSFSFSAVSFEAASAAVLFSSNRPNIKSNIDKLNCHDDLVAGPADHCVHFNGIEVRMLLHKAQIIGKGTPDSHAPGYEFGEMLCPRLELDGSGWSMVEMEY